MLGSWEGGPSEKELRLSEGTLGTLESPRRGSMTSFCPQIFSRGKAAALPDKNPLSPAVKLLAGSEPHCSVVKFEEVFKW